jgi:hypothetical protein
LSISIGNKVNTSDLPTLIAANADSIRLQSSNIVVSSTNFSVTSDGHMTCNNASISGNITVGNNYGSITIKDFNGYDSVYMDSNGIHSTDWYFQLNKDVVAVGGDNGASMTAQGYIQGESIDVKNVYPRASSGNIYTGYTGTVEYRQASHRNWAGFVNGILVNPDAGENWNP